MNDYWQKLTITADKNLLEIISADIVQISNHRRTINKKQSKLIHMSNTIQKSIAFKF